MDRINEVHACEEGIIGVFRFNCLFFVEQEIAVFQKCFYMRCKIRPIVALFDSRIGFYYSIEKLFERLSSCCFEIRLAFSRSPNCI